MRVFAALVALVFVLATDVARADEPGDWVAKLAPGASADATKALSDSSYSIDQLGTELDLLTNVGTPAKIAETLQTVQKASHGKY